MPDSFLLTGAAGFLGQYIEQFLHHTGYGVTTLGRQQQSNIRCDLSQSVPQIVQPAETAVHIAGKAHMLPKTAAEKQAFFDVNVTGTKNLCKGLETSAQLPKHFVFISTAAVYGREKGENINEQHPLQGSSAYALSKIEAERYLQNWCSQHGVKLSILRLPLIAGSNPPGNLGSMIKAIQAGFYFNIGGGLAGKSMVLAADVAAAIPVIAATGGTYNLTDGQHPSFSELSAHIARQLGKPTPKNLPIWAAKTMAFAGNLLGSKAPINSDKLLKIMATLTFDDSLARRSFRWQPQPVLEAFSVS